MSNYKDEICKDCKDESCMNCYCRDTICEIKKISNNIKNIFNDINKSLEKLDDVCKSIENT